MRSTPTRHDESPRSLASGIERSRRGVIGRVERAPRLAGALVLLVAIAFSVVTTIAVNGVPFSKSYKLAVALPGNAPLLKAGDEVRIAGVRAGSVSAVEPEGDHAVARLELDDPPGELRHATVRLKGMAGAVYVELSEGPAGPAEASVDLQHVVAGFDAATREALASTLRGAGGGLAGRGESLNATLGAAPQTLEDLTPLIRAVRPVDALIDPARTVSQAVAPADQPSTTLNGARHLVSLGNFATAAAGIGAPLADSAPALGATIGVLPSVEARAGAVLPQADPVLRSAAGAARELQPAVAALARLLPGARGLEREAGRLADARTLLDAARPVLQDARPVVADDARWVAATLLPTALPTGSLARALVPYAFELVDAPAGFDRWGGFSYSEGQGSGHKAVRFTMIFTCDGLRDPYPAPGAALKERQSC